MNENLNRNFWAMVIVVLIAIVLIALFGCSPQRKLNRLIKKHPELLRTDTILWADTLIQWGIRVDTATSIHFDTLFIEKEKLKIRLIRVRDSIFVKGEVLTDTIYREFRIPYNPVVVKELTFWEKYGTLIWILVFLLLIIIVLYLINRLLSYNEKD